MISRSQLRDLEDNLSSNKRESVCSALHQLVAYLPEYSVKTLGCDLTSNQNEFLSSHYYRCLELVFKCMNSSWDSSLSSDEDKQLLYSFVLKGTQSDALIVLLQTISDCSLSYKLCESVNLLEAFITTDCTAALILGWCRVESNQHSHRRKVLEDDVLMYLVSLPDRMANKLQNNNRDCFVPENYFKLLAANILLALSTVHDALQNDQNCNLKFISALVGRCCFAGHSDDMLGYLIPHLINNTKDDFIWRRICHRLFSTVPDNALENMLVKLVNLVPHSKYMTNLLGDGILKNNKMQLLLTQKLLFMRTFENDAVLQNILGYIANSEKEAVILTKVFVSLMEIWGDKSAIKHASYDQHFYITRALIVAAGLLKNSDADFRNLGKFTQCITAHIHSPHTAVRRLGMVTAKTLIPIMDPSGTNIDFEFEIDDEVKRLQKLVHPVGENDVDFDHLNSCETITIKSLKDNPCSSSEGDTSTATKRTELLDSDDDDDELPAYDMSGDTVKSKLKKPLYVRDCMEGLIEKNEPERIEGCLQAAEELILKEGDSTLEVAVEFAKILLHTTNDCGIDNFSALRAKALVALLTKSPIPVAFYLTQEFYDRNYSICQRIDILEALANAAQQLSRPEASKQRGTAEHDEHVSTSNANSIEDWKTIVQKRIEAKTRRFGKGPQKQLVEKENQFAPVSGHFFFPLMTRYDKREQALDLLGEDCLVLGRLLYTLGIIMYSAVHAPALPQMGKLLLDFLWALRYHTETYIRRALLFCLCIIVTTLPAHTVITDLQDDIIEFSHWTKDILQNDADPECQKLAAMVSNSLANTFKEAFIPPNEI